MALITSLMSDIFTTVFCLFVSVGWSLLWPDDGQLQLDRGAHQRHLGQARNSTQDLPSLWRHRVQTDKKDKRYVHNHSHLKLSMYWTPKILSIISWTKAIQMTIFSDPNGLRKIVSVGQFRPEKDHASQIRAMFALRQIITDDEWEKVSNVRMLRLTSQKCWPLLF